MFCGEYLYLLIFFSAGLILYFLFPQKYRYIILLILSITFAFLVSGFMAFFLIGCILVVYFFGKWISKENEKIVFFHHTISKEEYKVKKIKITKVKKRILFLAIVLVLLMLIFVKYFNFIGSGIQIVFKNISIPTLILVKTIGISYYSLSSIGYLIDIYRGKYNAEKNILKIALFVSYYPALIEGPINQYDKQGKNLTEGVPFSSNNFKDGFLLVSYGLIKKMILADRLSFLVSEIFTNYDNYNGFMIILGVLGFTAQLYFDFSGVIDIVNGGSEMFGIRLERNFEQPFFSSSVSEFWRRWHITLGSWFRDYVFYPLSMSKFMKFVNRHLKGKIPALLQTFLTSSILLLVVWFLTGLWHGADVKYILYGFYYYFIIIFETMFSLIFNNFKFKEFKVIKLFGILKTFILVNIGMLLFKVDNIEMFWIFIKKIFVWSDGSQLFQIISRYDFWIIMIGVVSVFIVSLLINKKINIREYLVKHDILRYCILCVIFALLIFYGIYGEGYVHIDPIYGDF